MATVRVVVGGAMRALRSIAVGDDPTADELIAGLEAVQALVLEIHEARGPLWEIDVCGPYTPGEDQRVRVQAAVNAAITLPNSVPMVWSPDPFDYGFARPVPGVPPAGSTGPADGVQYRPPRDGSRIEIVGTSQALFFYRADLNQWMPVLGLTIDTEAPLSNRLTGPFEALVAERLADVVSTGGVSPVLGKRIAMAREALFSQTGRVRSRRVGEYF